MAPATQERILEAAVRVLSARPNATIDEIAAEARVGRATVFRHFDSRAGLLKALARRAIAKTDEVARLAAAGACTATDALRAVTKAVVGMGESFRFLESAGEVYDQPEIAAAYERQMREMADLVRACRREGFIHPEIPTAWVAASIDGLIWAASRAVGDGQIGVVQAQDLVWETITRGVSAETRRSHQHVR